MATFNVIGYTDPFTELYVCYCYEWNIVGTGSDRGQALSHLESEMDYITNSQKGVLPLFLTRQKRRFDIEGMFCSILVDKPEPTCARKISSGHRLEVYHFPKERIEIPFDEEQRNRDIEEYEMQIQEEFDEKDACEEILDADIPF